MSLLTSFSTKAPFFCAALLFGICLALSGQAVATPVLEANSAQPLVAVLPFENLSGAPAPLRQLREEMIKALRNQCGIAVLEEKALEDFMAAHRVRYVGGIDSELAVAFRQETGAQSVLITSFEFQDERVPLKICLTSRLVSTANPPIILWMDSVGLSGDDSPGLLGLGLIHDPAALRGKALARLASSLLETLEGRAVLPGSAGKFRPRIVFRSPVLAPGQPYVLAVLPFFNRSDRKNGGDLMALQFIKELARYEAFQLVEPGVIRQVLLRARIIMDDGLSLSDAAVLFSELRADLILSGKVLDYQESLAFSGSPVVDFSALLFEAKSREIVWASDSHNEGADGVYFYDWGKISTASDLASRMVRSVGSLIAQ